MEIEGKMSFEVYRQEIAVPFALAWESRSAVPNELFALTGLESANGSTSLKIGRAHV